ncbi:MAG: glutamate synthase [Nitrososphaerota archaeon]
MKSGCGIFGVLRLVHSKPIQPSVALSGIECVRYRGSRLGAGFATFKLGADQRSKVKLFAKTEEDAKHVYNSLRAHLPDSQMSQPVLEYTPTERNLASYNMYVKADAIKLWRAVQEINMELSKDGFRGRIYSWGRYVDVFKGIGYPADVYEMYGIESKGYQGDLWIAHTRQPTNSPGRYPIWSHPFASGDWAIVHNGDISSFGANMELLWSLGYASFVGTDSEVIAYLLDYLTNFQHLNVQEVAKILCNRFTNGTVDHETVKLLHRWRGARLDGPFSVIAGYCDGYDVYLLAFADRFKFRPIVVGQDENYVFAASEEAQIRTISPAARVWTLEPGEYFLASLKRGILYPGRALPERFHGLTHVSTAKPFSADMIDASHMDYQKLNKVIRERLKSSALEVNIHGVRGQRYIGVGIKSTAKLRIFGTPGNCLGNLNAGLRIEVFGNVQDDVGDVMTDGSIIVHGDARDVLAQAFQGGKIYIKGNAGNRCGIQMREFRDRKPILIVGGRVDDYLGEYMAGGIIVVLGLNYLGTDVEVAGNCVASGMVGGRIYIRGRVSPSKIGLAPPRVDVLRYLWGLVLEGLLPETTYGKIASLADFSLQTLKGILPSETFKAVSKLYTSKYWKELVSEYRLLNNEDVSLLGSYLQEFAEVFNLQEEVSHVIRHEPFTVIYPRQWPQTSVVQPEEG